MMRACRVCQGQLLMMQGFVILATNGFLFQYVLKPVFVCRIFRST